MYVVSPFYVYIYSNARTFLLYKFTLHSINILGLIFHAGYKFIYLYFVSQEQLNKKCDILEDPVSLEKI